MKKKNFLPALLGITVIMVSIMTVQHIAAATLEQSQMQTIQGSCECWYPCYCDSCLPNWWSFNPSEYTYCSGGSESAFCLLDGMVSDPPGEGCGNEVGEVDCGLYMYRCGGDYTCNTCTYYCTGTSGPESFDGTECDSP